MLWQQCQQDQEYMVGLRRELHRVPELGTELPRTRELVCRQLEALAIPFRLSSRDSGVIAHIQGARPGRVVALRADMDALPINEETGLDYASIHPGRMHACGHDAHMAMLLGAAKALQAGREQLSGQVRLLFQTAEERVMGAPLLIDEGCLEGPPVDAVFGQHIGCLMGAHLPSGTVVAPAGCCMASSDHFYLTVCGHGCHGSTPEQGVDPISIAAHIILALQELLARELSATRAGVLTVGLIQAGAAYNIIPDQVRLEGTIRALNEDDRRFIARRLEEIATGIAASFRGSCQVRTEWGPPPVVNDPAMAALAAAAARQVVGPELVITDPPSPSMVAEDFAYYLLERPGAFFFLSSANPAKGSDVAHHNSRFQVDEDVLWQGAAILTAIAEDFLAANPA